MAVAACIGLLGVAAAGCSTTQEKASAQKVKSEHILQARADRQAAKKREQQKKHHGNGKEKGKKK